MSRGYHNLAGFCRDLRAASIAASEGDSQAAEQLDHLDDALGLFDAVIDGDLPGGQEGGGDALGDDAEDEGDAPVERVQGQGRVDSVGSGRQGSTVNDGGARGRQFSTRKRQLEESRPRPGAAVCRIGPGGKR